MTLTLKYAGFNYVADVDGSYADANSLSTMIAETDSNSVALTDDYAIDPQTSTVYADTSAGNTTGITETLANLTTTIEDAEADGLTVMVRPLIDFSYNATHAMLTSGGHTYADGDWRAYYNPANVATFFASYKTMIVAEAQAAQAGGAQLFDIGTELDQLTGPDYTTYWDDIISAVRTVFHGALTYSAISDDDLSPWQYGGTGLPAGTGDITTQVSFWSKLDYVGIDEYAVISDANNGGANPDPTLQQLIAGWEDTPTDPTTYAMTGGLSLIQYYENIAAATGKPLLFTELGYESAPDAASQPPYTSSDVYDPSLQAKLYEAFFDAWKAEGNTSLEGVYIWNWEPDPSTVGAGSSPNWTPQGNAGALQAVDVGYGDAGGCFCTGTRILTDRGEIAVEALRVGDRAASAFGGTAAVTWIGHRRVDCRRHPRPHDVWPVRLRRGAFAEGQPRRDLLLSPDHAVFVDGVLMPVRYLINGATIVQEPADSVTYWHVELPHHDVLLAEGMPCESYLDTGNRGAFDNGAGPTMLHPDFARRVWQEAACAELVMDGPDLQAARFLLLARAEFLATRSPPTRRCACGWTARCCGRPGPGRYTASGCRTPRGTSIWCRAAPPRRICAMTATTTAGLAWPCPPSCWTARRFR